MRGQGASANVSECSAAVFAVGLRGGCMGAGMDVGERAYCVYTCVCLNILRYP